MALRPGLVLGYARNEHTYDEMQRRAGYRIVAGMDFLTGEVTLGDEEKAILTFEGSELVRGGGGPRCMTMPLVREDLTP